MMKYSDLAILTQAADWLNSDHIVCLATIISVSGPSPRPLGSIMVITKDGDFTGSISGGCIEQDLLEYVRITSPHRQPSIRCYGGSKEEQRRFQLPCGGAVEVCLEWLYDQQSLQALISGLQSGQLLTRSTDLRSGEITLTPTVNKNTTLRTQHNFSRLYGPQWRLFIVGAGDLSRQVAELALGLDYHITVSDPREEYAHAWQIPHTLFLRNMPDDAYKDMIPDSRCAVLTLTHDPKLDDMALLEALTSPAFFVGALGSKRSAAQRLERLHYMGLSTQQTCRLHAPVGLPIGSHSAAEIAISIMAQLIQVRNQQHISALETCQESP